MIKYIVKDFTVKPVVKILTANAGNVSSIPGLGRSHRPWSKLSPHLYSECMYHIENSMMDHVTNNATGTNIIEK